jgi:hypothetical protein
MVDPRVVNIKELPWMPLTSKASFACKPCVYFVLNKENQVVYVGKAQNSKARWQNHEKTKSLAPAENFRIAFFFADKELIHFYEAFFIKKFSPVLNKTIVGTSEINLLEADQNEPQKIDREEALKALLCKNYIKTISIAKALGVTSRTILGWKTSKEKHDNLVLGTYETGNGWIFTSQDLRSLLLYVATNIKPSTYKWFFDVLEG